MTFKIDTKPTYTVITPETAIMDVNLAAALRQKVEELAAGNSQNFVMDMHLVGQIDMAAGAAMVQLHHDAYSNGCSLVWTALTEAGMQTMKKGQYHLSLNLAPTLAEAVDIISMEVLERDILGEVQ
ncbi:MAG: hypothetical protein QM642_09240 [Edaphocola sp.]